LRKRKFLNRIFEKNRSPVQKNRIFLKYLSENLQNYHNISKIEKNKQKKSGGLNMQKRIPNNEDKKFWYRKKSGITITSLTIYVIVATIIVTILVFLNANFFSNINDLTNKSNIVSECLNFKAAFIRDLKSENDVKVTDYNTNMVRLSNNIKYEIRVLDKNVIDSEKQYAIYRNDAQIAKSVVPHTHIDGQIVRQGPFFEYDVDTNTLKVGIKFSDGKNAYIENESYTVGKEIQISWENSPNNSYLPTVSGDITGPEVPPEITQDERIYAILYNDGMLTVTNYYRLDQAKVIISDYGEISTQIDGGNAPWLADKELIRTVDFAEPIEITNLSNLFSGCLNLNEIRNTKNVITENATSANSTFKDCENLKTLDISTWKTSLITDMSQMFDGCENLTTLNLNTMDTNSVVDMSAMLRNCSNLKELTLNQISTANVNDMSEMFSGCSSLISLDLNTFSTTQLEKMSNMFSNCTSLVSLNISNFDTSKVTDMNQLFYNCRSLASVTIKNFDTSAITNLSYFFYNCNNLTTIDFGTMDTSLVTDMSYLFSNCTKLTNINFGEFSTEAVTNMEGMFYNCQSLEKIDLKQFETSEVENMSQMFAGCMKLDTFENLTQLDTRNVMNMSAMFKDCSLMKILDLNNGVFNTAKVTNMSEMFKGCGSLYELYVDGFDTSLVEDMSSMFESCSNLPELNLQYFNTESAIKMNRMFMNSSKLEKIIVGDSWDTTDREVTDMFTGCGTSILEKV